MFCKKCGKILMPKKKNDKIVMSCIICGNSSDDSSPVIMKETLAKKQQVEVVEKDNSDDVYPIAKDAECGKCGNKEAYYWLVQTRAGDEAATKFFKCTKCKHIWRDYS
jgi:transcription factor S